MSESAEKLLCSFIDCRFAGRSGTDWVGSWHAGQRGGIRSVSPIYLSSERYSLGITQFFSEFTSDSSSYLYLQES